ncbi:universal stress protein [Deltaproteobacteria bacterium TL4]
MIQMKHILLPTDCSEPSKSALRYAFEFGKQFQAEVTLLTVVDNRFMDFLGPAYFPNDMFNDLENSLEKQGHEQLKEFADKFLSSEVKMNLVVLQGDPVTEIIHYAKDQEIDVIIIGTHGHTGLAHMLLGSIAEKVVRHAPCPVLTVKPDNHQFIPLK